MFTGGAIWILTHGHMSPRGPRLTRIRRRPVLLFAFAPRRQRSELERELAGTGRGVGGVQCYEPIGHVDPGSEYLHLLKNVFSPFGLKGIYHSSKYLFYIFSMV